VRTTLIPTPYLMLIEQGVRRCCVRRTASSEPALSRMRGERLHSWPTVPGVPVPQRKESYKHDHTSFTTVPGPPAMLQPGSNASFSRNPTAVLSSNSALTARDRNQGSSFHRSTDRSGGSNRQMRQPFPSRPIHNNPIRGTPETNWVDASFYNGPPQ
jgi:hypothetical protein